MRPELDSSRRARGVARARQHRGLGAQARGVGQRGFAVHAAAERELPIEAELARRIEWEREPYLATDLAADAHAVEGLAQGGGEGAEHRGAVVRRELRANPEHAAFLLGGELRAGRDGERAEPHRELVDLGPRTTEVSARVDERAVEQDR